MRIAWVTPLSAASAIGEKTARVADQLREHVEVHLWTSDSGRLHPTSAPVIQYSLSDFHERMLRGYGAVLYNFGDHYLFHRDVYLMSQRVAGIAVLHDFVMHHFFVDYFFDRFGRIEAYLDAMARLYGESARAEAQSTLRLWSTDRVIDYPFFEEALQNATGVIVHSEFLQNAVRKVTPLPVTRIHLPADAPPTALPADADEVSALGIPEDRAVLLTVGHVNPNKRVREVVEVLGQHPDLAARVIYVVVGELPAGEYPDQLRETIATYGLESTVRLLGRRSDEELRAWQRRADVCVTLRHPVMEGASASLVNQLMYGKAVVVANAGVYGEMPDDCVMKISPGRETDELPAVLRRLLDDVETKRGIGQRGFAFAEANFRADRYATDLLAFVDTCGPSNAMSRYADNIGRVLSDIGVQPGMPIVQTVAGISADLFGEPVSSPWKP